RTVDNFSPSPKVLLFRLNFKSTRRLCRCLSTLRARLYVMNNMRVTLGTQCINISKAQATIDWIGARLHSVSVNLLYIIISLFYFSRYSTVIWKCVEISKRIYKKFKNQWLTDKHRLIRSRTPCDAVADHQGAADPRLKTPDLERHNTVQLPFLLQRSEHCRSNKISG